MFKNAGVVSVNARERVGEGDCFKSKKRRGIKDGVCCCIELDSSISYVEASFKGEVDAGEIKASSKSSRIVYRCNPCRFYNHV